MNQESTHDYYYGCEAEQYTFYRFPKALFTNDRYKGLSDGAKILYDLMLDRMGLPLKNGWLDDANRVFIYFTLEDLKEYMSCGHNKGVKLMAELDTMLCGTPGFQELFEEELKRFVCGRANNLFE